VDNNHGPEPIQRERRRRQARVLSAPGLTVGSAGDTVCHMKAISLRELHEKTGHWVRRARHYGEILVTDRGEAVARLTPEAPRQEVPYFARRVLSPAFRKLAASGRLSGGTDSTAAISEDREERGA
jgi:prevent-host-death family protein